MILLFAIFSHQVFLASSDTNASILLLISDLWLRMTFYEDINSTSAAATVAAISATTTASGSPASGGRRSSECLPLAEAALWAAQHRRGRASPQIAKLIIYSNQYARRYIWIPTFLTCLYLV
jgi:hypothetical protein